MSDPAPQSIHGPGGLLATPGLGAPRKRRRKWGQRLKDSGYSARAGQTIRGNLARGGDGKFTAAGNASAAKPKRGIVLSKQPKPTARPKPTRAAAPKKAAGKKPAGAKPKDPAVLARQAQRDREHAEDRAQRQADRQARMDRQAAHDAERVKKQQDTAGKRAAERIGKGLQKLAPKPTKAAAGGGSSKKPSADDKRRERSQTALDTAGSVGISGADLGALRDAAEGLGGHGNATLTRLGLIGPDGQATDQGRRALSALERGDVRQYRAALQDAASRMGREQAAAQRRQQTEGRRAQAAGDREKRRQQKLDRLRRLNQAGRKLTRSQLDQATEAGVLGTDGKWKSFTVFKDHAGQHRWIARTTTAYRDRDHEILTVKALEDDAARMTATGMYGPLRWHHVGEPDPFDPVAPWGPGLDIGTCDFSIVIGRTSIESGTFKSAAIGQAFADTADDFELSPGFFHPIDQPGADGAYHEIRRFERSPVPVKYGRASNLFTGLTVKEHRMDPQVYEQRVKTYLEFAREKGVPPDVAALPLVAMEQADKSAEQRGIVFKSTEPPPAETIYYGPDNQPGIIQGGAWIALKAAPPDVAEVAAKDDGLGDIEVMAEGAEPETDSGYEAIGDMTRDEFAAFLSELFAPVLKLQDMVKSIGDTHAELKTMYGGVASKDDSRAQELATLKSSLAELTTKIAQIEGDQPSTVLPDDVAEAFKSEGPAKPAEPAVSVHPALADPTRPFAGWGAQTFPELYVPREPA